jgi:hypothetical protein
MTVWTKRRVQELEATVLGWVRWSAWIKSEISTQLQEMGVSCRRIGEIQKEDNKALQWLYGERGEAEGAKMQQNLTSLLTAASVEPQQNTRRDGLISTVTAEAVLDPLLSAAVSIRERNRRLNVVRIEAWAAEISRAAGTGDLPRLQRATAALKAELV